jgi:hypothetical protein
MAKMAWPLAIPGAPARLTCAGDSWKLEVEFSSQPRYNTPLPAAISEKRAIWFPPALLLWPGTHDERMAIAAAVDRPWRCGRCVAQYHSSGRPARRLTP